MNPIRIPLFFTIATSTVFAGNNSPEFTKQTLTDEYYCDGINAGDINGDRHVDIVAGPFWYEGPNMKKAHAFYPPEAFERPPNPTNSMFSYLYDFDRDGGLDILVFGRVQVR